MTTERLKFFDPTGEIADALYVKYRLDMTAVEFVMGVPKVIHHVKVPYFGEKGFYRHGLSAEAFRSKWRNMLFGAKARAKRLNTSSFDRCFMVRKRDDFEFLHQQANHYVKTAGGKGYDEFKGASIMEHVSIWDFYNHIGWNYKRKAFGLVGAKLP